MHQKIINAILSRGNRTVLCDILYRSHIVDVIEKEDVPCTPAALTDYIRSKRTIRSDSTDCIDANYCIVLPGAIDPHVHYDDPGFEWREDFYTGTLSAAFGGVTTVADMPCTSIPAVTDAQNFRQKLKVISKKAITDLKGEFVGQDITPLARMPI